MAFVALLKMFLYLFIGAPDSACNRDFSTRQTVVQVVPVCKFQNHFCAVSAVPIAAYPRALSFNTELYSNIFAVLFSKARYTVLYLFESFVPFNPKYLIIVITWPNAMALGTFLLKTSSEDVSVEQSKNFLNKQSQV